MGTETENVRKEKTLSRCRLVAPSMNQSKNAPSALFEVTTDLTSACELPVRVCRPDGIGTVLHEERDRFLEIKDRLRRLLEHQLTNFRSVLFRCPVLFSFPLFFLLIICLHFQSFHLLERCNSRGHMSPIAIFRPVPSATKPAILIMTSLAPRPALRIYVRTDTLLRLIYRDIYISYDALVC